jgi:aminoglycoside phosphotransferase (APT) family kinase protein
VHLVARLLEEQFPDWADLPVERYATTGSDHVLYRLGDELVARLPRKARVDDQIDKERAWLPRLAPSLPVAVPVPLAKGAPGAGYPFSWSVYRWLKGDEVPADGVDDHTLAVDLAAFVRALGRIESAGGPHAGLQNFLRGAPLALRDEATRAALAQLEGAVDTAAATAAWEEALRVPAWTAPQVWVHGDLTPENMLAQRGRLAAILDFGCLGVGDPAVDVMVAWSVFSPEARAVFRAELDVDEATWVRGRGWALSTGLIALPYYAETHPPRAANARFRIRQVLADA